MRVIVFAAAVGFPLVAFAQPADPIKEAVATQWQALVTTQSNNTAALAAALSKLLDDRDRLAAEISAEREWWAGVWNSLARGGCDAQNPPR